MSMVDYDVNLLVWIGWFKNMPALQRLQKLILCLHCNQLSTLLILKIFSEHADQTIYSKRKTA